MVQKPIQALFSFEPNIVIFLWRAGQLLTEAEGWGKKGPQIFDMRDTGKHDILR